MFEYLILNNHLQSAHRYHQLSPKSYKQQLLSAFQKGKRAQFLKTFHLLRNQQKLQFYLRVYFLIYSIHPSLKGKNAIPQDQCQSFKQYLDNKGNDLAKTNQFLQFYALPFVKKPHQHPSFKTLFKKQWVNNLTQKLNIFINDQHQRMINCCKNLNLKQEQIDKVGGINISVNQEIKNKMKGLQQKNKKLFQELQIYKVKFSNLQQTNQSMFQSYKNAFMQSHNKWLQITKELTNNSRVLIELISKSQSSLVNHRRYQRIKKRTQKFQKMVKKQLDQLLNQSQDLSIFDKPSVNQISHSASITPNISQRNITTFISIDQYIPINYFTLIKDFKKMPNDQKIKILKGFSWRIIKSKNKQIRRQIIVSLIVNDLLGIMNGQILQIMSNQNLMYSIIKLFLYISQDTYGIKVLFRNGRLYKQIVDLIPIVLQLQRYDCLQVILEILQNIWHNKQILIQLINLNIISICSNLLQDQNIKNSDQLLESISTLLLNTTAINQGLDSFEKQINIFYILCQAFKQANDSNRNLIGAIIYALLGRKNLWKLAHEAKLPNFIDDLIKIDLRSNKQQLYLIQQKLIIFQKGKIMNSIQYQQQSQDSNLDDQVYQRNQQQITNLEDYIKGHQILNTKYYLKNKQANKQLQQINNIMKQFQNNKYQGQGQGQNNQQKGIAANKKQKNEMKMKRQQFQDVRFPQVKKKNNNYIQQKQHDVESTKKNRINSYNSGDKQYYSYKSPNFKQNQPKQQFSLMDHHNFDQQKIDNFQINQYQTHQKQVKSNRYNPKNKDNNRYQQKKVNKSKDKPDYRIKKSNSLQKINKKPYINAQLMKNQSNRQEQIYQSQKSNSNIQNKNLELLKSPPQGHKKSRQEVLRLLNKELKGDNKKVQGQQRKISAKMINNYAQQQPLPQPQQRQNVFIKKNPLMMTQQQLRAFSSKPKIRRTPPHDDD